MDDTTRVAVLLVFGAMAVVGLVQLIRGLSGLITCARIMAGDEVPGRVISARTERQRTRRAGSRDRRTVLRRREVVDFRTRDGKRVQGRPWAYDGHLDADGKPINRQGQQVWVIHNRQNPEKFVAPLKRGVFTPSEARYRFGFGVVMTALGVLALVFNEPILSFFGG